MVEITGTLKHAAIGAVAVRGERLHAQCRTIGGIGARFKKFIEIILSESGVAFAEVEAAVDASACYFCHRVGVLNVVDYLLIGQLEFGNRFAYLYAHCCHIVRIVILFESR